MGVRVPRRNVPKWKPVDLHVIVSKNVPGNREQTSDWAFVIASVDEIKVLEPKFFGAPPREQRPVQPHRCARIARDENVEYTPWAYDTAPVAQGTLWVV